jgi:hypothetical protein
LHKTHLEQVVNLTDTNRALDYKVRVLEKYATLDIPKEYKAFRKLFKERTGAEVLPKHQP